MESGTLSYAWTGPGGFTSTSEDITALAAGNYDVTVTDANGCTLTATIAVGNVNSTLAQTHVTTDATCAGNNGAIDITVTGGTGTLSYAWTGPGGFTSTSEDITGLAAGDYDLTVTDANGCVLPVTITVGQTANTLAQTNAVTLAGCGVNNGAIDLTVTGGVGTLSYAWTGPGGFTANTEDITGLAAGNYDVLVTDANGCTLTATIAVGNVNSTLAQTHVTTDATCVGNNGAIDITVTGGTGTLSYAWTGPGGFTSTSEDITGLAAGDYDLTVTDANGCVLPVTITVGQTANTLAQTNAVTLAGCGVNNGAIDLTVTGGVGTLSYAWTGPGGFTANTEDITGLAAGNYSVLITDANGCTLTATIAVGNVNSTLAQTHVTTDATCVGNNGAIDITVTGGTGTLTYAWTGPGGFTSASEDLTGLAAGDYDLTVTDGNGCVLPVTITVGQTANTLAQTNAVTLAGCGVNNGAIDLTVTGNSGTLSYAWTGPGGFTSTSEDITGLAAGNYSVTVTDANGCTLTATIAVGNVNSTLAQTHVTTDATCVGNNGAIDITVTGGAGTLSYAWTGPGGFTSTSEDITGLAAGDYDLTVTDANGCVLPVTITVGQTANTLAQTSAVTLAGCGVNNGAIDLTVTGNWEHSAMHGQDLVDLHQPRRHHRSCRR